jgi:hypothetical protein
VCTPLPPKYCPPPGHTERGRRKRNGNDAPPARWPPEDFFGNLPPSSSLSLSLFPSLYYPPTALITGQDNTHHQGTTEGKGERRKEKGEGRGSDAEAASEGIVLDPPTSLSLSLYLCTPHPPPSSQDKTTHPRRLFLCFDPTKEQKKYEQPSPAILSEELFGPFFVISPAFLATTRPPR